MRSTTTTVSTAEELIEATNAGVSEIVVDGVIEGMPMITLAPGTSLSGGTLRFGARSCA